MALPVRQVYGGSPYSDAYQPAKTDIIELWQATLAKLGGANAGALIQTSKTALDALAPAANTMAWVIGDADPDLDGVYQYSAGTWTRRGPLPYGVIHLNNAGAGTGDAIEVTTAFGVPDAAYGVVYSLNITEANTGPVTISINGDTPVPVVSNTGALLDPGALQPEMGLLALDDGTNLRLFVYGDVQAILNAAEVARDEAQAARDSAQQAASSVQSPKATVAAAVADTPASDPDYYLVAFYDANYVGDSGGRYRKVASEPSHAGKFQNGNGTWYELAETMPSLAQFGVRYDPVAGQTAAVQAAIDYALAKGRRFVRNDIDDVVVGGTLTNRSNVVFLGSGSFRFGPNYNGYATYRRSVVPIDAPSARAFPEFDAGKLRALAELNTVKVVLVGDSLTTYGANANVMSDPLAVRLSAALKKANPKKTINFISRGIGGTTWDDLDAATGPANASQFSWYTNTADPWLDYVEAEQPDVLIFSFGMNDASGFDRAKLESVMAKVAVWAAPPRDIVFCTNFVPTLENPDFPSYGTYDGQEGRDFVAGWTRAYAAYYGHQCLDFNRTFNTVRDGRDILNCYFEETETGIVPADGEYVPGEESRCRDWEMDLTVAAGAFTNASVFYVSLSNLLNNAVFIQDNGAGFLRFRFFRGGSASEYDSQVSAIPTPVGEARIILSKQGNVFRASLSDESDADRIIFERRMICAGGLYRPTAGWFSAAGGPVLTATFKAGREKSYMPTLLNDEIWGHGDASAGTKSPFGGNGVNHPTSVGVAGIYDIHLAEQNFAGPGIYGHDFSDTAVAGFKQGTNSVGVGALHAGGITGLMADEEVTVLNLSTALRPNNGKDNVLSLGGGSYRWSTVYAATGTINTSDAREKTEVRALTDAEHRAAKAIAARLGAYQWLAAVDGKGDEARLHFGVTAQHVAACLDAEGLEPARYGFWCADALLDDEGNETGEIRYGLRYSELVMFLMAGIMLNSADQ